MKYVNEDFDNLNVFCFDLAQYNPNAKYLVCTVFVNYKGELWYADVNTWLAYYFRWKKNKWVLCLNLDEIKYEGLMKLVDKIKES